MKQGQIAIKKNVFLAIWGGLILCVLWGSSSAEVSSDHPVVLAKDGHATAAILLPSRPGEVLQFAAKELRKYLLQLSGASFDLDASGATASAKIRLAVRTNLPFEGYRISVRGRDILLSGGSERAVLYAAYDFLGRLGCAWLAPDFAFYHGHAGYIPKFRKLSYYAKEDVVERPVFRFRKLDIIGRNSTVQDLVRIIDWMPKLRFNTVVIPFGGSLDRWEKLRTTLVPELRKRGLLLELGGHGYQRFLSASEDSGRLFRYHPNWFGRDSMCQPVPSDRMVFNTENPEAVRYFIDRVIHYLRGHPEVDLFDLWPPDGAEWPACKSPRRYPSLQQAALANQVDSAIKKMGTGVRLEIIAYDRTLLPPDSMILHPDILVDLCPIDQNFESQIDDTAVTENARYVSALKAWQAVFSGAIGIYSYYRKSAWRSLPVVIPRYIQHDLRWYAARDMKGISCYAYHDDWFTYELNHYILGQVAWNPEVRVDSLLRMFCVGRYGAYAGEALSAELFCGHAVRTTGSLPFSRLKALSQIAASQSLLKKHMIRLKKARSETRDSVVSANLSRLLLMLDYFRRDLSIQRLRSLDGSRDTLEQSVKALGDFLSAHGREGVFQLSSQHQMLLLRKHYGLTDESLLNR
jgi:hypothetical protein